MFSGDPLLNAAGVMPTLDGRTPVFVELGADPRTGAGFDAPIGSIARFGTSYFIKVSRFSISPGVAPTEWQLLTGVQYTRLSATATTISFQNLNGDLDVAYEFMINIAAAATFSCTLRPNGLTTNQRSSTIITLDGAAPTAAAQNTLLVTDTVNTFSAFARGTFYARKGAGGRGFEVRAGFGASGVPAERTYITAGWWNENATLVTSLDFVASVANGFGNTSEFILWPVGMMR